MSTRRTSTGEASLLAWGETMRFARRRVRTRKIVAGIAAGCAVLCITIVLPPSPRLVWNASASAPVGLYWVSPGARVRVGDMVFARMPAPWRAFAAARRYLPSNVPLVKRVAATADQTICARGDRVLIDGRLAARRLVHDPHGRTLPWWSGCTQLTGDQLLLLMPAPDSFDGRYFGVTDSAEVIGKARLLWRR